MLLLLCERCAFLAVWVAGCAAPSWRPSQEALRLRPVSTLLLLLPLLPLLQLLLPLLLLPHSCSLWSL